MNENNAEQSQPLYRDDQRKRKPCPQDVCSYWQPQSYKLKFE